MAPTNKPPIDFGRIAAAALQQADTLVERWLPGGKRVGHEWQCGSLSGDAGSSCSVNLNTGAWADFATDEAGGDLISLYGAVYQLRNGPAARELAEQLGMTASDAVQPERARRASEPKAAPAPDDDRWSDAGEWPEDGPPAPVAHVVRGRPVATWCYRTAAGGITGYVHRFVTSHGGKEILPCVWSQHPTKGKAWKWRQWDQPRPLYRLELQADDRPVLVVEGEKCVDAAASVLGATHWVTTWSGGGNAVHKADFGPLAGRRVILWPDCDAKLDKASKALLPEEKQPGVKAMEKAAQILLVGDCDVSIVAIPRPGDRPDGWDIADLIAEAGDNASAAVHAWLQPDKLRRPRAAPAGAGAPPAPPDAPAAPPPWPEPEDDWSAQLVRVKGGNLASHPVNVSTILRNDSTTRV